MVRQVGYLQGSSGVIFVIRFMNSIIVLQDGVPESFLKCWKIFYHGKNTVSFLRTFQVTERNRPSLVPQLVPNSTYPSTWYVGNLFPQD